MKTNPIWILLFGAILVFAAPVLLAEPTISNFMAAPGNAQVMLSWNASSSGTGYNVKQASSTGRPLTVIATNLPNPNLVVTNLRNGTAYFFAVSSVSDGFESADTARLKAVPSVGVLDLLPAGVKLEKLASGFASFPSIEGPVWSQTDRRLIFSDNVGDRLMQWTPGAGISVFRQPVSRPNGSALDLQGRLITCEQLSRLITRTELDGTVTTLASEYNNKQFNEPNDVVIKSDGTIWFTDPAYRNTQTQPGNHVFRFDPADGNASVTPVATEMGRPNGLCFSPDEMTLFVSDTDRDHIRAFDVRADNSLTNSRVFVTQGADGMRATSDGRLYICNSSGVRIYGLDGLALGVITVPESPAHLCFGGTNREMLFITASGSLYGITRMPDLIVTAINCFPTNAVEGQSVAFSVVVKNQGTAATSEDLPTRIALSINGKTNAIWSDGFTSPIPPDASVILTVNGGEGTSTWIAARGTNSIKATVDTLDAHRESNETNNVLSLDLTVAAPAPDSDGDAWMI